MITKNVKIIISGVLFTVATVCFALYRILFCSYMTDIYGIEGLPIPWGNIIITTICASTLILYCFALHKTKIGKKIYLFGFGAFALLYIYFILSTDGRFDLYVMSDILFLAITVFMLIIKIKTDKSISIAGTIVFIIYAVAQCGAVINDLLNGFPIGSIIWLFFYIHLISQFIALFILWLIEGGNLIFTKEQISPIKTLLENDLVSIKQLFDNGMISEEEYNQKKTEILNKL